MIEKLTDPGVLVGVLALIGTTITAYFLRKSTKEANEASSEKAENDAWASLLNQHRIQLDRIHQDYQAELASNLKRFRDQMAEMEHLLEKANDHGERCDQALKEAKDAISDLQAKVSSLEQTRRDDNGQI